MGSGPGATPRPLHVGIIMDGNGRWATARGLPRGAGHEAGVAALRRTLEGSAASGIGTLTVYAFSEDNWRRPPEEVAGLMALLRRWLAREAGRLARRGVRLSVIGRRDRLGPDLAAAIARAEARTRAGARLHLRIAFDYSGRQAILAAAARAGGPADLTREGFARLLAPGVPEVDLVIRTGGEQRLSDFLLWESAYAELWFTRRLWPDFGPDDLAEALAWFRGRARRFGALPETAAAG